MVVVIVRSDDIELFFRPNGARSEPGTREPAQAILRVQHGSLDSKYFCVRVGHVRRLFFLVIRVPGIRLAGKDAVHP
jgi:hypothetical protein